MKIDWRASAVVAGAVPFAFLVGVACGAAGEASAEADAAEAAQAVGTPVPGFDTHVVATHFLRGREYQTHHYFKGLRDGVLQGLVFRETTEGAPLIEVEWAIAREVWEQLPAWQRAYWHPLFPAVDAGRVRLPDLSADAEDEMLATVRGLYAQTFNLAGLEGELPVGLEGVAMVTHLTVEEIRRLMGMGESR